MRVNRVVSAAGDSLVADAAWLVPRINSLQIKKPVRYETVRALGRASRLTPERSLPNCFSGLLWFAARLADRHYSGGSWGADSFTSDTYVLPAPCLRHVISITQSQGQMSFAVEKHSWLEFVEDNGGNRVVRRN